MERLMHETRETFTALVIVTCLATGIGGAVFYTLGPDGWLVEKVRAALLDPNIAALAALLAVIGMLMLGKRLLDRHANSSVLNNLLVGTLSLGGFVILLQGLRTVLG
ncbi:MAG: hypothetical protein DPW12_15190 [Rhodocyclaceae bacterium]|nr:hypothetical protein [Rhodocyclaceae bacterium]MCC7269233.1 hypothetical protein [Rhodocyclaceae bacterium]MCQ3925485.1 hypothetical protein [Rhodocyclaceae bacterium]